MSQMTDKGNNCVKKKTVFGIILIAVSAAIFLLTFQDSAGTVKLSETFRQWFEKTGIHSDFHSFRSNAHLVVYFILGVALSLYGNEAGWKWWVIILAGCGFGLMDEAIKILLPTREFDAVDLVKDCIGVVIAVGIVMLIRKGKTVK